MFIRLLARLTDLDVSPSQPSLPDQLSQWIDWTRAVTLSRALERTPPAGEPGAPLFDHEEQAAYARTRASLVSTLVRDSQLAGRKRAPREASPGTGAPPAELDYLPFRQHYQTMQRAMQTASGRLRGRLRELLGAASADLARLAEVDAVMEMVLSPREHSLLATVPGLLGAHFERLRLRAAQAPGAMADDAAWLDVFRKDMQGVLLAELDVRFLPLEGLLAALGSHSQGSHVQTSA